MLRQTVRFTFFLQGTLAIVWATTTALVAFAQPLGPEIQQLIVSVAPEWSASQGTLQRYERGPEGPWRQVGRSVPVLYGKNGLAWGRGIRGAEQIGLRKREGDGRSPAGVFAIGTIYGNEARLPEGADYPFHQVTANDAWPDDPANPFYNKYVAVEEGANPPAWFASQRMRLGDPAYRWRVEIRHNADPIEPGAGSATFFHIRRSETRRTSACTTMAESDLHSVVVWLRAAANPHYVLLPREPYERLWQAWGLPPLEPGPVAP